VFHYGTSSDTVTFINPIVNGSDARMKRGITPIQGGLSIVERLRGVTYYWKDAERSARRQVGVIAQEVERVVPELVHTGADGYKAVEYTSLIPILIEAVKELLWGQEEIAANVADHSDRLELLESENAALIEELDALREDQATLDARLDRIEEACR
jgi:hypothetical protein